MSTESEQRWFTATTHIVLEGLLLACAMTLPFLLVSGYMAGLLSAGVGFVWSRIRRFMANPDAPEKPEPDRDSSNPIQLAQSSAVVAAAIVASACGPASPTLRKSTACRGG